VKAFSKSSADHTFYYGIDLLSLTLLKQRASVGHVTVAGEGAASSNGQDAWPWLLKDATSMTGVVGDGDQLLPIRDGAVRSKDAADQAAQQKLGAVKDGASRGRFRVLGFPTVRLGDAIEIKEAPKPELNGLFKVIGVRHILSKTAGFLTEVDFSGQGGAQQAAGLLGGLAGKLAGALGI
jgi:hypothetical protein